MEQQASSGRPSIAGEPMIDVEDAAKVVGCSETWVYRKAKARELPSYRVGRKLRFLRSELEQWLRAQSTLAER